MKLYLLEHRVYDGDKLILTSYTGYKSKHWMLEAIEAMKIQNNQKGFRYEFDIKYIPVYMSRDQVPILHTKIKKSIKVDKTKAYRGRPYSPTHMHKKLRRYMNYHYKDIGAMLSHEHDTLKVARKIYTEILGSEPNINREEVHHLVKIVQWMRKLHITKDMTNMFRSQQGNNINWESICIFMECAMDTYKRANPKWKRWAKHLIFVPSSRVPFDKQVKNLKNMNKDLSIFREMNKKSMYKEFQPNRVILVNKMNGNMLAFKNQVDCQNYLEISAPTFRNLKKGRGNSAKMYAVIIKKGDDEDLGISMPRLGEAAMNLTENEENILDEL